jgi:hypothetical protein
VSIDAPAIIQELARKSTRIRPGRGGKFVNCGLNREKVRFQVLFRATHADVGLVFDEADAVTNQHMAAPYEQDLEREIQAGTVRRLPTASNVYLIEKVAVEGAPPAEAAERIWERLNWWWTRFEDRPEPPLDLSS